MGARGAEEVRVERAAPHHDHPTTHRQPPRPQRVPKLTEPMDGCALSAARLTLASAAASGRHAEMPYDGGRSAKNCCTVRAT
jgi:hypothetical protein